MLVDFEMILVSNSVSRPVRHVTLVLNTSLLLLESAIETILLLIVLVHGKILILSSELLFPPRGWSGGAMVLGKLPVPGRPTIWITVGQGPTALAVGAGGGCMDIFTLIYPFFPLSPSLWEMARYRLKYCLKGPLNPKPTNQPTNIPIWDCELHLVRVNMDALSDDFGSDVFRQI